MAAHLEETEHGLTRELIDDIKRTGAIGCTSIITQVQIVVLGQALTDGMQDGKTTIATIEHPYGTWSLW